MLQSRQPKPQYDAPTFRLNAELPHAKVSGRSVFVKKPVVCQRCGERHSDVPDYDTTAGYLTDYLPRPEIVSSVAEHRILATLDSNRMNELAPQT